MNEVMKTLLSHRSIRAYEDKPVEEEILRQILKAAQAAPNWINLQHVSIVVVRDKARRERMAEYCGGQKQVAQAPVFLVFCADFYRTSLACKGHAEAFAEVMGKLENLIVGIHEVGIALEAAVVAAESFGLGTVPIGGIRLHALDVIEELELPRYVIPVLGLCVGYPAEDPGLKPRLPMEAVCFDEKYNTDLEGLIGEYDKEYALYLKDRPWNSRAGTWSDIAATTYKPGRVRYLETEPMLRKQGYFSPEGE